MSETSNAQQCMNGVPLYAKNTNVHFDDMTTVDATIDILADVDDDNTIVDNMDTDIIVDAVHVYIHGRDPKGRGKPSSTREPDGIG